MENKRTARNSAMWVQVFAACSVALSGCSWAAAVKYPPADKLYFTVGDATISEYNPVGYVCAHNATLFSSAEQQAEKTIQEPLANKVEEIGGNGVINGKIEMWESRLWFYPPILGGAIKVSGSHICGQAVRLRQQ